MAMKMSKTGRGVGRSFTMYERSRAHPFRPNEPPYRGQPDQIGEINNPAMPLIMKLCAAISMKKPMRILIRMKQGRCI